MTGRNDWDPRAPDVLDDQLSAYDTMRERCPVAHSDYLHYSVFRHADVRAMLEDETTYSNQVSRYLSVPNGMDPPEHTVYRAAIDRFFSAEAIAAFAPECAAISRHLVAALPRNEPVEIMQTLADPYAVQVQCAFLGWSEAQHQPLLEWIDRKHAAIHQGDREAIAAVANEFDQSIRDILQHYRALGTRAPDDVTQRLLQTEVHGRQFTTEELVSILRNWTVGELGTLAASVGIIAHFLAHNTAIQTYLRANLSQVPAACDEILRLHGPLLSNRRVTTREVSLGGRTLPAGTRLTIMWAAANRDGRVFEQAESFRLDRDPAQNLLYGKGIHACPGEQLARLELSCVMRELLTQVDTLETVPHEPPRPAHYPASGYAQVSIALCDQARPCARSAHAAPTQPLADNDLI